MERNITKPNEIKQSQAFVPSNYRIEVCACVSMCACRFPVDYFGLFSLDFDRIWRVWASFLSVFLSLSLPERRVFVYLIETEK